MFTGNRQVGGKGPDIMDTNMVSCQGPTRNQERVETSACGIKTGGEVRQGDGNKVVAAIRPAQRQGSSTTADGVIKQREVEDVDTKLGPQTSGEEGATRA